MVGDVRFGAMPGVPGPPDDVRRGHRASITDVRCRAQHQHLFVPVRSANTASRRTTTSGSCWSRSRRAPPTGGTQPPQAEAWTRRRSDDFSFDFVLNCDSDAAGRGQHVQRQHQLRRDSAGHRARRPARDLAIRTGAGLRRAGRTATSSRPTVRRCSRYRASSSPNADVGADACAARALAAGMPASCRSLQRPPRPARRRRPAGARRASRSAAPPSPRASRPLQDLRRD